MKPFAKLLLATSLLALSSTASAANNDPIVLLHGFGGWDRNEMFGYLHWGGTTDIQEELKRRGHPTVTAAVGPVSSTWDRAVELYYQLKGGCVDYGAAHAAQHGHARYGRCHTARVSTWDETHKVHIIAHSQGAPTANMLVQLLRSGYQAERNASGAAVADLYKGGKNWVRSVTTVAGANNGTTFGMISGFNEFAKELLKAAAATLGATGDPENLPFDFKLDQWGLVKQANETQKQYWNRVWASPIWNTQDIGLYTLSPNGAAAERTWVQTSPEVYYFSFINGTTFRELFTGNHIALPTTNLPLIPFANGMGAYRAYGEQWLENDGVVNTVSMKAPFGAPVVNYNGVAQKGKWNYMGYRALDHWDVIGSGDITANLTWNWYLVDFYNTHANLLHNLN